MKPGFPTIMQNRSLRSFNRLRASGLTSLQSQCMYRIATILQRTHSHDGQPWLQDKACYYFECLRLSQLENLPPRLLQDLLETCIAVKPANEFVRYAQIAVILESGQLERLCLWAFRTTAKDFSLIMRKTRGKLKELEVDRITVCGRSPEIITRAHHSVDRLIEANCATLTRVTLGISLNDLLILSALRRIEQLTLNFQCACQLNEIVVKSTSRDHIWPSLRGFRYGDLYSAPTLRFICYLLEKCPLLSYLDADVADALLRLHESEFLATGIGKRYPRIEKILLGSLIYGSQHNEAYSRAATMMSTQIAIEVFPNLRELDILVDTHDCIVLLNQFAQLSRLRIKWISKTDFGEYSRGLQIVLLEIGCQLRELCLHGFQLVDMHEVSYLCPNLDSLGIIECTSSNYSECNVKSFEKLRRFRFVPPTQYLAERANQDLLTLISGPKKLERFIVEFFCQNDEFGKLVHDILGVNLLKHVYMAGLHFRVATTDHMIGPILQLITACTSLQYLTVGDIALAEFLRSEFPRIRTQYELLYVGL